MSNTEGNGEPADRVALAGLEGSVGALLDRIVEVRVRAEEAEAKSEELEEIVRRFTGDEAEAGRLLTRLSDLEEENTDLHGRLKKGRSGVDRLLAKIRFLEAQR
ncbi:MAG TPA: hypothetical protein EYQ27_01905 [Gemmatimonadetes bacterium]|nr:hypothetical protein [Gemmatimonadota bacterium]